MYIVILGFSCFSVFFFFFFDFPFKAPGLRLPPQVWLAFCMASISIYCHNNKTVTENKEATILWDMQIHTDKELSANKPDIVIKDHANRCCKLIDVSVPSDRNTSTKAIEELSKYKDLEMETTRMWGMRTETVPVIVGALGLIREGMEQNLGKIPGASNINELQKIILLGTAHILRRFLSIK